MSTKINTIIVEDEPIARKALVAMCKNIDAINLIADCESAEAAQPLFEAHKIELILLDIEMPGMSGLELLESLSYLPQIIFTTSNKEYAFNAFEYDVTDFLKKPISRIRLLKAIDKAIERQERLQSIATASASNEIYVKADKKYIRLAFEDILYFENVGDYVSVVTKTDKYIIYGSLKSVDAKITHPRFLKVHRSYIVNLGHIVDIEENNLVIGKKIIPISRAHKPVLFQHINFI